MDIQQVKKDLDNGMIVSRETWIKVLEAALIQQAALVKIEEGASEGDDAFCVAHKANWEVKFL